MSIARHHVLCTAVRAAVLLLTPTVVFAQFTSAIDGTVSDQSGAVVANAHVTLRATNTGTLWHTDTSASGHYVLSSLPAAPFEISVTAAGFETSVHPDLVVGGGQTLTVNVALKIGTAATAVTVNGQPPPIDTVDSRISGGINEKEVHDLPLIGRNYLTVLSVTPGVTGLPSGGGQSYAQSSGDIFTAEYSPGLNANGARGAGNNFMVDSASTNNVAHGGVTIFMPNAETIQEVVVLTNNFSAEYGRNSSIVVNAITKGGTNAFHGTASWYHTNNDLAARTEFQDQVPVFRRNETGATLGGPIVKNHTFFFGSFDRLDSSSGSGSTVSVLTPGFVDFVKQAVPNNISAKLLTAYSPSVTPTTNFTTVGNLTGTNCSSLSSASAMVPTVLGAMPCNFQVYGQNNWVTTSPRNGFQWNARVDHYFDGDKDRLYGNVYRTNLDTSSLSVYPAFTIATPYYANYANLSETHTFSPTMINEIAASYVRVHGDDPCNPCSVPGISIQGLTDGIGQGWSPGQYVQNVYEYRDMASLNRGKHTLKFGAKLEMNQDYDDFGRINLRPSFYFSNPLDFANDNAFSETGIGINPVNGQPPPSSAGYIASQEYNLGIFAQDNWKVRPNLTINMGLRWEMFPNLYQRYNQQTNILLGSGSDLATQIANASVGYTANHHILNSAPKTWSPRFGIAWDPFGNGHTSIRGGVGVFYDRLAEGPISTTRTNPPLIAVVSASQETPPTLPIFALGTNTDPFNFPYPTGIAYGLNSHGGLLSGQANVSGAEPNLGASRTTNWFFGIQHALFNNLVLEADYVGSSASGLYTMYDLNRFDGDLIVNKGVLHRLNPYFGTMNETTGQVGSLYQGATFVVKKQLSSSLQLNGSYTFAKTLDGANVGGGGNEYDGVNIADPTDLSREHALAVFDVRQRLSFTAVWQIPGLQSQWSLLNHALGGWQLSGVTILQGGQPFSVYCSLRFQPVFGPAGNVVGNTGCDYNADGFNYDYPNTPSWGNSKSGLSRSAYINGLFQASEFPAPTLGQEGNLGRDTFRGPGFANSDVSLLKNFNVPWFWNEAAKLQFRADVFNVFNRVNLTQVDGDMGSSTFGHSTSTYPARDIQIGLRLSF